MSDNKKKTTINIITGKGNGPSKKHCPTHIKHPEIYDLVGNVTLPSKQWFYVDVLEPEAKRMQQYIRNVVTSIHKGYRPKFTIVKEDTDLPYYTRIWFQIIKRRGYSPSDK